MGEKMSETIDGMFKKIPFEEAVIKIKDYARKNVEYTHQGAVLDGERPLDKEYTEFIVESKEYHSQFSQDELQALVKRAFEEIRQPR